MLLKSEILSFKTGLYHKDLEIRYFEIQVLYKEDSQQYVDKLEKICEIFKGSIVIKETNGDIIAPFQFAGIKTTLVNYVPTYASIINELYRMFRGRVHSMMFIVDGVMMRAHVTGDSHEVQN